MAAKKPERIYDMKKFVLFLAFATLTSCANFQVTASQTLATVQGAAVASRETLLPVVDGLCTNVAEVCRDVQDLDCQALVTCQEVREQVIMSIIAIHYAILDANTALAIGDETTTWAAIDKALELIRQLRVHMMEIGIGV